MPLFFLPIKLAPSLVNLTTSLFIPPWILLYVPSQSPEISQTRSPFARTTELGVSELKGFGVTHAAKSPTNTATANLLPKF